MAAYFASDVHLRLDQPERSERFGRWVDGLGPGDSLVIAGDLCDFWLASRQRRPDPLECAGLKALVDFRERGGLLTIMAGNHDLWLGPFYEQTLGTSFVPEPLEVEAFGLRVHLVHGHRLGARSLWKWGMESRLFLHSFRALPGSAARRLEHLLDETNAKGREASDRRHLAMYHRYAESLKGRADLVVFGHIHQPLDEPDRAPRLVVLGGWKKRSSFLVIDEAGARLIVENQPQAANLEGSSRHGES